MNPEIIIREATRDDVGQILRHRRGMYEDMDYKDQPALNSMVSTSESYFLRALADGSYRGWLALAEERVVAGGGVVTSPWPSHPYDLECRKATILNMYTHPDYRRRGIARRLMKTMIEWCRKEGFDSVFLHASEHGRPLYESLGFKPTNEMRLKLR